MATFYRGATLDVALTITDTETGLPVDLTGATVKFRLGPAVGTAAAKDWAMANGAGGTASLTIPPTDTLNYNGPYTYTVHVTESAGRVFMAAQGVVTFTNIVLAPA